jgi:hypothetical protein
VTRCLVASIALAVAVSTSHAAMAGPSTASDRSSASLATVRIPFHVQADGKELAPGVYELRLTDADASPTPAGETVGYERWVELVQHGDVKGREVASIVPASEIQGVAKGAPPPQGQHKIEVLKGNVYLRIWLHRDDRHYLVHLPISSRVNVNPRTQQDLK